MSDRANSAQRPADSVGAARAERLRHAIVAGVIVILLAVAVVMLRLYRLDEVPPGVSPDQGSKGMFALEVLQGEHSPYFSGRGSGREGMVVYAIALTTSLLGRTMLAIRLPSALASAGTVFVVFWLGHLLFGRDEENGQFTPWRGMFIGGAAAGMLAVSIGQTIVARTVYRANLLPFVLSLCLALLWWGWSRAERQRVYRGGAWYGIALTGACAGLLPYTYPSARFAPLLFLFFGLSFLLPLRAVDRERAWADLLKRNLPWIGIFVGATGLVAAPILVYFALHPDDFFLRFNGVWLFRDGPGEDPLGSILRSIWKYLLALGFHGDSRVHLNFEGRPILNPWEALLFWIGVGISLWRWQRRPAYRLLLLWVGTMLLPAILTEDADFGPNSLRMIGAAPAIFLLVGVGLWEAFEFLRNRFSQLDNAKLLMPFGVFITSLILIQGVTTFRTYFLKWAPLPVIHDAFWGEWADAARLLNAERFDSETVYLVPFTYYSYGFHYLYHGAAPVHFIYTNEQDLPQKIESTLATVENAATVKVFDWNDPPDSYWDKVGDEEEQSTILLSKYGRYLESVEYRGFQLHTFTDIDLERPWRFLEQSDQLSITYDGGISLQLLALGQGPKQLPSEQLLEVRLDRPMWVALKWQTIPGLEIDFKVSLRLQDAEGNRVYQDDSFLLQSYSARTSQWSPDKEVDTWHIIDFPADFPPGEYEIRLVVYDSETLKPTAQMDVWQPEITLARLRLADVE